MSQPTDTLLGIPIANRYQILRQEREEELGTVYVAKDLQSRQIVSVKVLRPHLTGDPEQFGRFGRELLATAAINHANTVKMLDFGQHSVLHYFVMEHIQAKSLKDLLEGNKKLPPPRAIHIAAQIAGAMAAAHAEKIVHRNLNPSNILLLENTKSHDYVKVRDFGMARLQDPETDDGGLTQANVRVGSFGYMAPEYIEFNRIDPRGDLYALGCILYQMLTGTPPFVGKNHELMEAHILEDPTPPSKKVRGIKPWLDKLVMKMLSKSPEDRPIDAREVIEVLEKESGFDLSPPALIPLEEAANRAAKAENSKPRAAKKKVGGAVAVVSLVAMLIGAVIVIGGVVAIVAMIFLS